MQVYKYMLFSVAFVVLCIPIIVNKIWQVSNLELFSVAVAGAGLSVLFTASISQMNFSKKRNYAWFLSVLTIDLAYVFGVCASAIGTKQIIDWANLIVYAGGILAIGVILFLFQLVTVIFFRKRSDCYPNNIEL